MKNNTKELPILLVPTQKRAVAQMKTKNLSTHIISRIWKNIVIANKLFVQSHQLSTRQFR